MNYLENDYELLYMVNEDSDYCFDRLYSKYKPIIYRISYNYFSSSKYCGIEFDDIVQEGMIGFYQAIINFNNINSIFYTYCIACIKRRIFAYLRSCNTNYNNLLNNSLNYDDVFLKSYDDDIFNNISYEYTFIDYKSNDNYLCNCVFELKYNGFSNKEICSLLDCSMRDVYYFTYKYKNDSKKQINN